MARTRALLGTRGAVLLAILAAGVWAAIHLGLGPGRLIPNEGGWKVASEFFAGALAPALDYEADFVPEGTRPILVKAADAALQTVVFAAAAMSLAILVGLGLGFLASSAAWSGVQSGNGRSFRARALRALGPVLYGSARVLIAGMRSVHELLWAILLLSAVGITGIGAVIAIAIPYAGTLAKIYSEIIDEAPRDAATALQAAGASPLQTYFIGLLPRALGDMSAYTFYRFECALRSSAILGFFGYPTIGLSIRLSYENTYYHEVWTYLYTLFLLIVIVEWWSGALRRRFVA